MMNTLFEKYPVIAYGVLPMVIGLGLAELLF